MGSNFARLAVLSVIGLIVSACAATDIMKVEPNIFPANYKQEILDILTSSLPDPTNVRDAFIAEPVIGTVSKEPRYTVCVRYNGRDVNRQYMGSTDRIGIFYGGRLNQLIEPTKDQCARAPYKPFPELEKLCLAKKCD